MRLLTYCKKPYRFLEIGEVIMAGDLIDIEDGEYEDASLFKGDTIDERFSAVIRQYKE